MTSDELAHMLTMSGLEVEEVEPVAPPFSNVVVGLVREMAKHPDADRLNVCQVDVGTGTLLNIVCGAPNVRPGLKVVCAMAGAHALRLDAAQLAHLDQERLAVFTLNIVCGAPNARVGTHQRTRNADADARIGRAADDVQQLGLTHVHLADTQAVGIGMLLCFLDLADHDVGKRRRYGLELFHLQARHGERLR
eukprot:gene36339-41117_t